MTKSTLNRNLVKAKEIQPHNCPHILAVFLVHLHSADSSYQDKGLLSLYSELRISWNCALGQNCKPIPTALFHPVEKLVMNIL